MHAEKQAVAHMDGGQLLPYPNERITRHFAQRVDNGDRPAAPQPDQAPKIWAPHHHVQNHAQQPKSLPQPYEQSCTG